MASWNNGFACSAALGAICNSEFAWSSSNFSRVEGFAVASTMPFGGFRTLRMFGVGHDLEKGLEPRFADVIARTGRAPSRWRG